MSDFALSKQDFEIFKDKLFREWRNFIGSAELAIAEMVHKQVTMQTFFSKYNIDVTKYGADVIREFCQLKSDTPNLTDGELLEKAWFLVRDTKNVQPNVQEMHTGLDKLNDLCYNMDQLRSASTSMEEQILYDTKIAIIEKTIDIMRGKNPDIHDLIKKISHDTEIGDTNVNIKPEI